MSAKSDAPLPGPMDGAPKRAGHKAAHVQPAKASPFSEGPAKPGASTLKTGPAPAVKTRGLTSAPR